MTLNSITFMPREMVSALIALSANGNESVITIHGGIAAQLRVTICAPGERGRQASAISSCIRVSRAAV